MIAPGAVPALADVDLAGVDPELLAVLFGQSDPDADAAAVAAWRDTDDDEDRS